MKGRWTARDVAAAALATALFTAGAAAPALAHRLGGKWSSSNYTYSVDTNGHPWYEANVIDSSSDRWANQSIFEPGKGSVFSATVTHKVYEKDDGYYGLGQPGPDPYGGTYTYGTAKINHHYVKDHDNQRQKNCVMTHEIGHVMGLGHNENTSYESIMYRWHGKRCHTWGLNSPQAHDENDLRNIY